VSHPQLEIGTLALSVVMSVASFDSPSPPDARLRVEHADPVIQVSDKLLRSLRTRRDLPGVTYDGDLLTVRAVNRTVIYRRREYVTGRGYWVFSWPD
jgi:hypothetical protein